MRVLSAYEMFVQGLEKFIVDGHGCVGVEETVAVETYHHEPHVAKSGQ